MTRKILLIILVLMLTLSSVAFVACDKDLDPFDIRQFYGDYHWVEYTGKGVHCSGYQFDISRIDENDIVSTIATGGNWYAHTITNEGVYYNDGQFHEVAIDQNVVDAYNQILNDFGKNFKLTKDAFICNDSNKQYNYNEISFDDYVKILELIGENYTKMQVEFKYYGWNPEIINDPDGYKNCTPYLTVKVFQDVNGLDGERYRVFLMIKNVLMVR